MNSCCLLPKIIAWVRRKKQAVIERRNASMESSRIDREIDENLAEMRQTLKLLLLGPSEVGKSTIVKQMRILHTKGFSDDEYMITKYIIYTELVRSFVVLADAYLTNNRLMQDQLELFLMTTLGKVRLALQAELCDDIHEMSPWLVDAMRRLLRETSFGKFVADSGRLNPDASSYFVENFERICGDGFVPISDDFLHLKFSTAGVVEISFQARGFTFRVVDVGGQKSERRKWLHGFEGVKAVIFLCALSDFNLPVREDPTMDNITELFTLRNEPAMPPFNRLEDALCLFRETYECLWFRASSFIMFFNKKDLLERKLKTFALKEFCEDYDGDNSYEDAATFIELQFTSAVHLNEERHMFAHRTCATDTNQMQIVLDSCIHTILEQNLKKVGMA